MATADGALTEHGESLWTSLTDDPSLQRYVPFALAALYGLLAIGAAPPVRRAPREGFRRTPARVRGPRCRSTTD